MSETRHKMFWQHPFHVGQRVRPSKEGIAANIFNGTHKGVNKTTAHGVVTAVDEFNSPTVVWSYRRTGASYAPWFVEPTNLPEPT